MCHTMRILLRTYVHVHVRYVYVRMCTYESVRTMILIMLRRTREILFANLYFEKNFLQEQLCDIAMI